MRRFKIFLVIFLSFLFSLSSSFAGIEDSKFVLDQLLKGKEKPDVALLVIDMQEDMRMAFDPNDFLDISEFQNELIVYANSKGIPIINIVIPDKRRFYEDSILVEMKEIKHKTYYKIADDAFHPTGSHDPKYRNDFLLYKRRLSSSTANDGSEVISEELGDYLRSKGIENVFLTGCFDSTCIVKTAKGALSENFKVYSDRDVNLITRIKVVNGETTTLTKQRYKLDSDLEWSRSKGISLILWKFFPVKTVHLQDQDQDFQD